MVEESRQVDPTRSREAREGALYRAKKEYIGAGPAHDPTNNTTD